MATRELPSQEVLRQLLTYDPETGKLFWKERGPEWFSSLRAMNVFNSQFAGMEALACVHTEGYLYGRVLGQKVLAHRIIWKMEFGFDPEFIDHVNGVRSKNHLENLRSVSRAENQRNMRLQKRNKTGMHGVHQHSPNGRWYAKIRHEGEYIPLGSFASLGEAKKARAAAEAEFGYHPNHGK